MKIQLLLLLRRGLRHPWLQEAHHLENEIEKTESYARDPWLLFTAEGSQLKTHNQILWCPIRSCSVLEHTTLDSEFIRYSSKTTKHPHFTLIPSRILDRFNIHTWFRGIKFRTDRYRGWVLWRMIPTSIIASFFLNEQIFRRVQHCIIYLEGEWDVFIEKSRGVPSFDLSTHPSKQWCAADSAIGYPNRIVEARSESNLCFSINGRLFYH